MLRVSLLLLSFVLIVSVTSRGTSAFAQPAGKGGKRAMKLDDLFRFKRVSEPQISPDGKLVVYVVATVDLEGNKSSSSLWLAPTGKGEPRPLTNTTKKDRHPRWSPDGQSVLFESSRSGTNQLWLIDIAGGEARQLTDVSTGAGGAVWSADGKQIAFASSVYPEFSDKPFKESDAANKKKADEIEKAPVKAKVFTKLFFRHWDSYVEDKRQHVFVAPFAGGKAGEPRDLTPGDRDFLPNSSTFTANDELTFSPDGTHVVFTASPAEDEAWSTGFDLCRVPVAGGKVETLTKGNGAADGCPVFSPDGKTLAYRAQEKAGYEADRWQVLVVSVDPSGAFKGKPKSVTASFDRSANELVWAGNRYILFTADDEATQPVFRVSADPESGSEPVKVVTGQTNNSLSASREGEVLAFSRASLTSPPEVYIQTGPTNDKLPAPRNLSKANTRLLAQLDLPVPESVTVKGAGGTPMQMWLLKPPGFDEKKKWPVAYLVHGGPQGAWEDGWSYRWCPTLWAAQGYVVALPNPRGSTGFGQKYVDEISGDWGGKCYDDLMKGADYVEKLPYVDKDRVGSAGASFGGYMMNWFGVNTGRFKCLITHCSVWNFDSMYGTTEELWFDEWEHGGPPWGKNRESYEKHSPQRLAGNLGKFKTPMLVIHNDLDFRCPIGQGHELFTALQRQKVPSRFINFPDEGHWVTKPKNSEYWHKEVFGWLTKHVPPGPKE